jgi:hypothetical protein
MDVEALTRQLGAQAQTQGERRLIAALESRLRDQDVPRGQRESQARAVLAREATLVLSLPWRIPRAAAAQLQQWGGWDDPRAVLRGMLALGVGRSALSLEGGRRIWVPQWVHLAAEERTGGQLPVEGERWAIPVSWPLPVRQVLIGELPQHEELFDDLLGDLPLSAAMPIPGPGVPAAWFAPVASLALGEDLPTLLAIDPWQGMRVLLTGWGHPLRGLAVQLMLLALDACQAQRRRGRPWIGQLTPELSLARCGETIVIEPGWLTACLHRLGLDCLGAPSRATQAVEEVLVGDAGGSLRAIPSGTVQVLPPPIGSLVRQPGLPWESVPDLDEARKRPR